MNVHPNSLETYHAILDTLPQSRASVMSAIRKHQPVTRQKLAALMNRPINTVTARVKELIDSGAIREDGTIYTESNKPRALLVLNVKDEPQSELF